MKKIQTLNLNNVSMKETFERSFIKKVDIEQKIMYVMKIDTDIYCFSNLISKSYFFKKLISKQKSFKVIDLTNQEI